MYIKSIILLCAFALFFSPNAFTQTGEVSGKVRDINGDGIRKGSVTLNDTMGNKLRVIITDLDGNFTATQVSAGKYNLNFSAANYISSTVSGVLVTSERSTWIADVYLSPSTRKKK